MFSLLKSPYYLHARMENQISFEKIDYLTIRNSFNREENTTFINQFTTLSIVLMFESLVLHSILVLVKKNLYIYHFRDHYENSSFLFI